MTEIERKALALVNEVRAEYPLVSSEVASNLALCRVIEQHEAFRREVSDAVADAEFMIDTHCDEEALTLFSNRLSRFIIPKPDPLAECLEQMLRRRTFEPAEEVIADEAAWLRAALAARGLEIREVKP